MNDKPPEERRAGERHSPGEWHWLTAVRLRPAREIRIINVSCSGALAESGVRLLPNARIELHATVLGVARLISGRVIRSQVCAIRPGGVQYRAALAFDTPLDAPPPRTPGQAGHPVPGAAPHSAAAGNDYPPGLGSAI
jgi:hypothetical protein